MRRISGIHPVGMLWKVRFSGVNAFHQMGSWNLLVLAFRSLHLWRSRKKANRYRRRRLLGSPPLLALRQPKEKGRHG